MIFITSLPDAQHERESLKKLESLLAVSLNKTLSEMSSPLCSQQVVPC